MSFRLVLYVMNVYATTDDKDVPWEEFRFFGCSVWLFWHVVIYHLILLISVSII